MPPPKEKPQPLTEADIASIVAELDRGNQPMVWFTSAAIGVEEGRSGKVVALGDPSEGDYVHVKPTGSKDVLYFSPTEVTVTKPAPKRAAPAKAAKPAAVKQMPLDEEIPAVTTPAAQRKPAATPKLADAPKPADTAPKAAQPKPAPKTGARPGPARKAKTPETIVTITGGVDGEWTVEVFHGKTRTVRGISVTGSAVARAAKELHPEVHDAVVAVLEAARGAQLAKVEQLQAELARAQQTLEELSE